MIARKDNSSGNLTDDFNYLNTRIDDVQNEQYRQNSQIYEAKQFNNAAAQSLYGVYNSSIVASNSSSYSQSRLASVELVEELNQDIKTLAVAIENILSSKAFKFLSFNDFETDGTHNQILDIINRTYNRNN